MNFSWLHIKKLRIDPITRIDTNLTEWDLNLHFERLCKAVKTFRLDKL